MSPFQAKIQYLDPNSLTPYVNNTKKHPVEQIDKIAQQIAEFGFDQPIVVDKDKIIIKGHGRREAALRLGLKQIPVIVADHLNELQVKAARIADNKVAESEWDNDLLRFEFGLLQSADTDLALTGFSMGEIDRIMVIDETPPSDSGNHAPPPDQFILSIELGNELELRKLYDELINRGYEHVKIIR